ncbi:MAG: hypothetical protein VX589_08445, partial [Myxococcota bacterium]|nr:hypothetical protein [Myxococcota bacterium]
WGVSGHPHPGFSKKVLLCRGRSNIWYPEPPKPATPWEGEIDRLLEKSTTIAAHDERKTYTDRLFEVFSDYQPQIQLVVVHDAAAARQTIGNFAPSALRPRTHWNVDTLFFR